EIDPHSFRLPQEPVPPHPLFRGSAVRELGRSAGRVPGDNHPAMSREQAISQAERYFDDGGFFADLARRLAIPTDSQNPERKAELERYLAGEIGPSFERLGFSYRIFPNPKPPYGPFLIAERIEDPSLVTVFTYGHGDVIRGQDASWRSGLNPWKLTREGDRLYGRGTADNKGQHSINLGAIAAALATRGKLGFN